MYDEKHRFHVLSATADEKDRLAQSGFWERLLCDACEGKFAIWERYGQRLLEGGEAFTARRTGDAVRVGGIDYVDFAYSSFPSCGAREFPRFRSSQKSPLARTPNDYGSCF